jgi:hypothetical protein
VTGKLVSFIGWALAVIDPLFSHESEQNEWTNLPGGHRSNSSTETAERPAPSTPTARFQNAGQTGSAATDPVSIMAIPPVGKRPTTTAQIPVPDALQPAIYRRRMAMCVVVFNRHPAWSGTMPQLSNEAGAEL